jgi:hypothetical protein
VQGIIRDDDISFFTTPDLLEAVYERVWERRIPVCLSVIPAHRANVRVRRRGLPYDPNIPPKFRGRDQTFPITDNPALCAYLRERAREGLVELVLHGYSHDWHEFATEDVPLLRQKLDDGLALLRQAFPDVPIRAFVAPYDVISLVALELVLERGLDVCVNPASLDRSPLYTGLGSYHGYHLPSGRKLFTAHEYYFLWSRPADACYNLAMSRLDQETLVVINHYWMFNHNWHGQNVEMVEKWHRYLDALLAQPRHFTTFSDGAAVKLG